jgi:GNAT superfamily N-acetyltransferase
VTLEIRLARAGDLGFLAGVERAAAQRFRGLGLWDDANLAVTQPLPLLEAAQRDARLWVAAGPGAAPVGFAHAMLVDAAPYLEEIDVLPDRAGRGVGTLLLDAVWGWARRHAPATLTLSTFRDVPWNAPFYARRGFRPLREHELGPGLLALRRTEVSKGLRAETRVFMRRES